MPPTPTQAVIPAGGGSSVAAALDAIHRAAGQPLPSTLPGLFPSLPLMPAVSPPPAGIVDDEAANEAGLRRFSIHAGDARIRSGSPDFTVVTNNGQNTMTPRLTRVTVTGEHGTYAFVEAADGQYSAWTHALCDKAGNSTAPRIHRAVPSFVSSRTGFAMTSSLLMNNVPLLRVIFSGMRATHGASASKATMNLCRCTRSVRAVSLVSFFKRGRIVP